MKTNRMAKLLRDAFNRTGNWSVTKPIMVTEFRLSSVAKLVLSTIHIFKEANKMAKDGEPVYGTLENYYRLILDNFSLDVVNNDMHRILWENWMNFMLDMNLILIEVKWSLPTELFFTENDIKDLEEIIKEQLDF